MWPQWFLAELLISCFYGSEYIKLNKGKDAF